MCSVVLIQFQELSQFWEQCQVCVDTGAVSDLDVYDDKTFSESFDVGVQVGEFVHICDDACYMNYAEMMMVNENHKHNANYHDSNKWDVDDMHDYDKEYVSFCDELTSLLVSHLMQYRRLLFLLRMIHLLDPRDLIRNY